MIIFKIKFLFQLSIYIHIYKKMIDLFTYTKKKKAQNVNAYNKQLNFIKLNYFSK